MATGRIGTGSWVTRPRPEQVLSISDPAPPRWSGRLTPPRSRTATPRIAPPRPENRGFASTGLVAAAFVFVWPRKDGSVADSVTA
jgi:hypothetical protein